MSIHFSLLYLSMHLFQSMHGWSWITLHYTTGLQIRCGQIAAQGGAMDKQTGIMVMTNVQVNKVNNLSWHEASAHISTNISLVKAIYLVKPIVKNLESIPHPTLRQWQSHRCIILLQGIELGPTIQSTINSSFLSALYWWLFFLTFCFLIYFQEHGNSLTII